MHASDASAVQRDPNLADTTHLLTIETTANMLNPFSLALIEGYVNRLDGSYELLSNHVCQIEKVQDKAIVRYAPKNPDDTESVVLMQDAVTKAEKLMPYTPRCILARNDALKAAIAVTNIGSNNCTTRVLLYNENNTIPYHLNKTTIDYLVDHIDKLKLPDGDLVIAITGEKFMLSDSEEFNLQCVTDPEHQSVFLSDNNSHMVVLSNQEIPGAAEYKISWSNSQTTDDSSVDLANSITPSNWFASEKDINGKRAGEVSSEILYDYFFFCDEDAILGTTQIPLYNEDGSFVMHSFCVTCAFNSYVMRLEPFYNQKEGTPRFDVICSKDENIGAVEIITDASEFWPEVPLGQLLCPVMSHPALTTLVRAWFTVFAYRAVSSSPHFDHCPEHPSVLLHPGQPCADKSCEKLRCDKCDSWHRPNDECLKTLLPPGFRVCPHCGRGHATISLPCIHMRCQCGSHFCYYCGMGNATTEHCHMHGFFATPPDIRKFILGETVDDAELEEFYAKYPHLREIRTSNPRIVK